MDNITTLFFYSFIGFAFLTLLYVLFNDAIDVMTGGLEIAGINPTLILSFGSILTGVGFGLSQTTELALWLILSIALAAAIILVSLLHVFVFVPIKNAEQNTAYSLQDYVGKMGTLTVPIPQDGLGQISIKDVMGYQSYPARTKDGSPLEDGQAVRIVRVEEGIFFVKAYQGSLNHKGE